MFHCVCLLAALAVAWPGGGQQGGPSQITFPFPTDLTSESGRGLLADSKYSAALTDLYDRYFGTRGPQLHVTPGVVSRIIESYGIDPESTNPWVTLLITVEANYDEGELKGDSLIVVNRVGNLVTARATLAAARSLADNDSVITVDIGSRAVTPPRPQTHGAGERAATGTRGTMSHKFDTGGLTGKGVLIGIIDSGLDWKHPDFINPDGTTRIVMLWDSTDQSFEESGIGSAPPYGGKLGTVYDRAAIDAALSGSGTVNSRDTGGHGTMVASVAGGNGRAAGNNAETYAGVAPGAEFVIVKQGTATVSDAAQWIVDVAEELGRPVVINFSAGYPAADRGRSWSINIALNELFDPAVRGRAMTVSAGNDGDTVMQASGRFGPKRPGQRDVTANAIEIRPGSDGSMLQCYFDPGDDWAINIFGDFLFVNGDDEIAVPMLMTIVRVREDGARVTKRGAEVRDHLLSEELASLLDEDAGLRKQLVEEMMRIYKFQEGEYDLLTVYLDPVDKVLVVPFGYTENVRSGWFGLVLPWGGFFVEGGQPWYLLDSPAVADNVITVGATNFRSSWANSAGTETFYNLLEGGLASYSSRGFRWDGAIKPDIAAPASYHLSAMSADEPRTSSVNPATQAWWDEYYRLHIAETGKHTAWQGTSASAPYVAGVIALMLEKNPDLTAGEIKRILIETATKDEFTAGVPNREFGYGKIDPKRAIAAVPERTERNYVGTRVPAGAW